VVLAEALLLVRVVGMQIFEALPLRTMSFASLIVVNQ
jgi:hypothetical protein